MQKHMYRLNLSLFDGGAAAPGAAAAPGGEGSTASNGFSTQEQAQIVYGKQAEEPSQEGQEGVANPNQEKKMTLKDIISSNPDIKAELEATIQRRVKNSKAELEAANRRVADVEPVLAMLYARYNVEDGDFTGLTNALSKDTAYLEEEAELKGMTVEQLQYVKQLEMENAKAKKQFQMTQEQMYREQLQQRWNQESIAVQQLYPDFDFVSEVQNNPEFEKLIRANVPVKDAYEFAHREEIAAAQQAAIAAETQKQITANLKAKQERPQEAGLKGQNGFIAKTDPSKLTSQDIREIRKRVARGEKISF